MQTKEMDTTNCPPGFATDVSFQFPTNSTYCATPIDAYGIIAVLAIVGHLLHLLAFLQTWRLLHLHFRPKGLGPQPQAKQYRQQRRIPLIPLLECMQLVALILWFGLMWCNLINIENTLSFTTYNVVFFLYALTKSLVCVFTLRRSSKLLPFRVEDAEASRLNSLNGILRGLFLALAFTLVASNLLFLVFTPVFPNHVILIAQIGFGMKSLFIYCFFYLFWFTFARSVWTIDTQLSLMREQALQQDALAAHVDQEKIMLKARSRLKANQNFSYFGILPPAIIFTLLAVRAVEWNLVLPASALFSSLSNFVFSVWFYGGPFAVAFRLHPFRRRKPSSPIVGSSTVFISA